MFEVVLSLVSGVLGPREDAIAQVLDEADVMLNQDNQMGPQVIAIHIPL